MLHRVTSCFSLQMSFLCTVVIVCLATGAYSQIYPEKTTVHVKVYAPPGFLNFGQEVFVTKGNEVNVSTKFELQSLTVNHYGRYCVRARTKTCGQYQRVLNCERGCFKDV